jgi:hypothetical protein
MSGLTPSDYVLAEFSATRLYLGNLPRDGKFLPRYCVSHIPMFCSRDLTENEPYHSHEEGSKRSLWEGCIW